MGRYSQLSALKTIIETEVPGLLAAAGFSDFDEYVFGGPTEPEKTSVGVYLGVGQDAPDVSNFKPVVQIQLPGVDYETALKIFDIVYDVIDELNPSDIGAVSQNVLTYTEWPPDESSSCIFTVYCDFNLYGDDCDY